MSEVLNAGGICKANYVMHVKAIMSEPLRPGRWVVLWHAYMRGIISSIGNSGLDNIAEYGIIRWTAVELSICGGHYVELEDSNIESTGDTQSSSRACHRRPVCHKRLLRPERSGAGQIRDASQGACGRNAAGGGGEDVRVFANVVLQHTGGVRKGIHVGFVAKKAGAEAFAQAGRRGPGISGGMHKGERIASSWSSFGYGAGEVQGSCASQEHTKSIVWKKGAVAVAALDCGECDLAGSYEQLRSEVLGEKRSVRQSLGWSHFVRRGMAGWIQAWMLASSPESEVAERERIAESVPMWPRQEVVSVLAGMAFGCITEVA